MDLALKTLCPFSALLLVLTLTTCPSTHARPSSQHHRHHHHKHHPKHLDERDDVSMEVLDPLSKPSSEESASGRPSHQELEADRVQAFQRGIMSRMPGGPPRAGNASAEELRSALRLYKQAVREQQGKTHGLYPVDEDALYAKQFHSFAAHSMGVWSSVDEPEVVRLHVPVDVAQPQDGSLELKVPSATLHLYRLAAKPQNIRDLRTVDLQVRVNVYQLLEASDSVRNPLRKLIDSKLVSLTETKENWETFDITEAVAIWLDDPESNHGLEISASGDQPISDVLTIALDSSSSETDMQAHASVYTQEVPIIGRQRRSLDDETFDCKQGDGESRCCRFPLWIDFAHIGWDEWVVQPAGYQAYFCDGSCPHRYKLAHNFAGIKYLINLVNPAAAPAPCCTASKLSSITLLHYNHDGHLVVTTYEDMVVEECKCA